MTTRGRFITLEGIEGAGKTTVARAINALLVAKGLTVDLTREPGGTPLAERIRELVLQPDHEPISTTTETLLMFAARALHVNNRIRPALEAGRWVLCDRFTDATRAYQGAGRGVDGSWIEGLAQAVHGDLQPDLTLLLDLPVMTGLKRARARREGAGLTVDDRFESETVDFFERIRAEYLRLARLPGSPILVLDASLPPEDVAAAAQAAIEQRFAQEFRAARTVTNG
jgi:dTMP kinase